MIALPRFRVFLVCFTALAVSLPMAWISLAKVLVLVSGIVYLLGSVRSHGAPSLLRDLWTPRVVLVVILGFAISLAWTQASLSHALPILVKHSKLLLVVLLVFLIQTRAHALLALHFFFGGQAFVLLSSWLLGLGLDLPWIWNPRGEVRVGHVVFAESYIDQSIMFSVFAVVLWHLGKSIGYSRWILWTVPFAAMANVLLLSPGRTGYIATFVAASSIVVVELRRCVRPAVLIAAPLIVLLAMFALSDTLRARFGQVVSEVQQFNQPAQNANTQVLTTSSGWRLGAWTLSLSAIAAAPVQGHGVGSWTSAVRQADPQTALQLIGVSNSSNPHQEYLLWGVELGVAGIVLLLAYFSAAAWDARRFQTDARYAVHAVVLITAMACLFNSSLFDDLIGDYLCVVLGLVLAWGLQTADTT